MRARIQITLQGSLFSAQSELIEHGVVRDEQYGVSVPRALVRVGFKIEIDDGERARCWTDMCALSTQQGVESISIATIGRYHDELARDSGDGRWRFRRRVIVMAGEDVPEGVDPTPSF